MLEGNHLRSVMAAGHGSQSATGPIGKEKEQEEEKEDKRQAELPRAQEKLTKCLQDEDHTGAAVGKANITALVSAAPCSQGHSPRPTAEEQEQENRQEELRQAKEQLQKCVEDEDYIGAAAGKKNLPP